MRVLCDSGTPMGSFVRGRPWWRAIAILCVMSAGLACGKDDPVAPAAPEPEPNNGPLAHRVLFIGNSLTAHNEVPLLVQALVHAAGVDSFEVDSYVVGGTSLEDHLNSGAAAARIASGGWDVVVLQQGPSTLPESRVQLRRDTQRFADLAAQVGARVGLYGVWPAEAFRPNLPAGIESYRLAAEDVDGLLFPAGAAWYAAWQEDPSAPLYGPDRFHPSLEGSYLAALTIAGRLANVSPIGMATDFRYGFLLLQHVQIPEPLAGVLQRAAAAALADSVLEHP